MSKLFGGKDSRPQVDVSGSQEQVQEEKKKIKKNRTALFQTKGGIGGEEIEQVQKRPTLFGN